MIDGIESVGAPERQSVGFWNTQCFCCGHAGLVQFFVGLYQGLGDKRYLDLARRTAAVILGEKEDNADGTTQWPMAFWRIKPDFLTVDLGYYDGQAGIASALLQLYLCETGHFHWNRLIDDPFPEI
jgi:lantibiotic modifying enzyme